jgi:hypothetical protein
VTYTKLRKIKIKGNSIATQKTHKQAIEYMINNEIEFQYIKKQTLNEQLYKLHLNAKYYQKIRFLLTKHILNTSVLTFTRQHMHVAHVNYFL